MHLKKTTSCRGILLQILTSSGRSFARVWPFERLVEDVWKLRKPKILVLVAEASCWYWLLRLELVLVMVTVLVAEAAGVLVPVTVTITGCANLPCLLDIGTD